MAKLPLLSRKQETIASSTIFLYLLLVIGIKGGFAIGIAGLWVLGVYAWIFGPKTRMTQPCHWTIAVFLIYFLLNVSLNLYHHDFLREYDLPLRYLLSVLVFIALSRFRASQDAFWMGLCLGSIFGVLSIINIREHMLNGDPVRGVAHLGNISMIIGLMCFSGWRWALSKNKNRGLWMLMVFLGGASGLVASVLTGTRGAWLAVPPVMMIYLIDLARYFKWPAYRVLAVAIISLAAIFWVVQHNQIINSRFSRAVVETQLFFNPESGATEHAEDTSVGQRWLMWKNAIHMIQLKPILGWGKRDYLAYKNDRIIEGQLHPQIAKYTDAHNDYIDATVKIGAVGLISLLLVYLVPMTLFFKRYLYNRNLDQGLSLCAMAMISGYMVSGLTATFMTINMNVMFYTVTVAVLFSLLETQKRPSGL
jgi:O-antigen ligase